MYSPMIPIINKLHAADHHHADDQRWISRHGALVHERLDQHPDAEHQRGGREQQSEQACKPQRRNRERRQGLDR